MNVRIAWLVLLASVVPAVGLAQGVTQSQTTTETSSGPAVAPEVPFVPTPDPVVEKMLDLANVTSRDVVYDLGSGDGRIVIAAAKRGANAIGVDINPERVEEGIANAKVAGVDTRARFINQDLFQTDLSKATVVTMYLLPSVNNRLRPKLLRELAPGTRVVSHSFEMDEWEPEKTAEVGYNKVYFWTIPERKKALQMAAAFEKEAAAR